MALIKKVSCCIPCKEDQECDGGYKRKKYGHSALKWAAPEVDEARRFLDLMPMRHEHVYEQVPPGHWADTVTRFAEEHYPLLFGAGRELVSKIAKGSPELALEAFWDFRGTTEQRDIDAKCVELWASELWTAIVAVRALREAHDRVAGDVARRDMEKRLGDGWELVSTVVDSFHPAAGRPLFQVNWVAARGGGSRHAASRIVVDRRGSGTSVGASRVTRRSALGSSRPVVPAPVRFYSVDSATGVLGSSSVLEGPGDGRVRDGDQSRQETISAAQKTSDNWVEKPDCKNIQPPPANTTPGKPFPLKVIHVSPDGTDKPIDGNSSAHGSSTHPLGTIQAALQLAVAGTEIRVAPGEYVSTWKTARHEFYKSGSNAGRRMRAACVFVNKSGQNGYPIRIVSTVEHGAHLRFCYSDSDLSDRVAWGVTNKKTHIQHVRALGWHAYGFLFDRNICHVEIDGFRISCLHRGVALTPYCSSIKVRNMLIEHLGTSRFGYFTYSVKAMEDMFHKPFGQIGHNELAQVPSDWLNQHVGIETSALTSDVEIKGCTIRHLGGLAIGASGAVPSPQQVGCTGATTEPCLSEHVWHHAFNHSHAIYAQGFGIRIENCTFYDVTQGSHIKIDGNAIAAGRPDHKLKPNNAGLLQSSHVIMDNCFGPLRNPSETSTQVVFYVNHSEVEVKKFAPDPKDPNLTVTFVEKELFNQPKNVVISRNRFDFGPGVGWASKGRPPVKVAQPGFEAIRGLKMHENTTYSRFLLGVRVVCAPPKPIGRPCLQVAPGYAPFGGWWYPPDVHGGDLEALIVSKKGVGASGSIVGTAATQLPAPTAAFILVQSNGSAGSFLMVNDGVIALYNTAKKLGWPLAHWPDAWPPDFAQNAHPPVYAKPPKGQHEADCASGVPDTAFSVWEPPHSPGKCGTALLCGHDPT